MTKRLVIVESPTKARTIEKFLGKDFEVRASYGHIRDLPNNAAEIPASMKKEKWARLGINVENDFSPIYVVPDEKEKQVRELKKSLEKADEVYLATDEDREGESISWHLLEVLKPKVPTKRLVFHEITKKAIEESLASPREIDSNLVRAQETRRIIDRLFGYSVSPLLWKKMVPKLSAGRVQSVAIRLLVERERARVRFKSAPYWDLKAVFEKEGSKETFEAELSLVSGKRVASGKDFDPDTGKLNPKADVALLDGATAAALRETLLASPNKPTVSDVERKPFTSRPSPPFTTSALQQEANRKLGFSARKTMQVAQALYENGLITYMRTDSTTLSEEALQAARRFVERDFGKEYLHETPRIYKTKVKNAQEAHEAIRPAGAEFAHPSSVRDRFRPDDFRLYELIWKRTIACQMKDAEFTRISVTIQSENATFRASGKTIDFPGFLRAYVEGRDDPEAEIADQERILPPLAKGEQVGFKDLAALSHETQPPARYTEGSLIKELEQLGIGRPSTWATIVDLVLSRDYAYKKGSALVPSFLAVAVTGLMERFFTKLVDYKFTADLEDDLDSISRGELDNLAKLRDFYFGGTLEGNGRGLKLLVENGEKEIDPRDVCGLPIGVDTQSRNVEIRIGRYGPFLTNGTDRSSVPDDLPWDELNIETAERFLVEAAKGPESLGNHPELGLPIFLKKGRFGPYVQLGEMKDGEEKPKMASLLPGMQPSDVNLDVAIQLLQFPKSLGIDPASGNEVFVLTGRFGPYIKCGSENRTIPLDTDSPLTITLARAQELLAQPRTRGRGSQPKSLKEVGKHPDTGATIVLKAGRYGPYVTDGTLNASLAEGRDPETLTIEEAIALLEARAQRAPTKKRGRSGARGKSAAKAKAPAEKKPAAKKAAAPKKTEKAEKKPAAAKAKKAPKKKSAADSSAPA